MASERIIDRNRELSIGLRLLELNTGEKFLVVKSIKINSPDAGETLIVDVKIEGRMELKIKVDTEIKDMVK